MPHTRQVYDYIDRHITKLDKDCKAFDAEIAKERQRLGLPPVEPTVGSGSVDTGKRKRKDGGGEQRKLTPEEQYQVGLMGGGVVGVGGEQGAGCGGSGGAPAAGAGPGPGARGAACVPTARSLRRRLHLNPDLPCIPAPRPAASAGDGRPV